MLYHYSNRGFNFTNNYTLYHPTAKLLNGHTTQSTICNKANPDNITVTNGFYTDHHITNST